MLYDNIRFFWGFLYSFFRSKSAVSGAKFSADSRGKKLRSAQFQLHFQELSRGSGTDDDDDDDNSAVGQFPPSLSILSFSASYAFDEGCRCRNPMGA